MDFRKEMRRELTEHMVPFWSGLRDDVHGGYYGYVDHDLHVDPTYEKGCILNSRILWFFSNVCLKRGDRAALAEADHAYSFLRDCFEDRERGGLFWSVTYDGQIADSCKHIYNHAFAIYGLASYYAASGRSEALQFALWLFKLVEEKYRDAYGYRESFTRDWQPEENEKLSEHGLLAEKTMNSLLHVMEAYTELYRVAPSKEIGDALRRILTIFREDVYNPKTHRLEVFFDEKMNSISNLYSYGHDIEASWLIDRACEVLGDRQLAAKTQVYTNEIVEEVRREALETDRKTGIRAMNNEWADGRTDRTKVWWVQAEAVVGFYHCYRKTGDRTYKKIAVELWQYIKTYFIDPREGSEWFGELSPTGEPDPEGPMADPWKCPYHNGRMCLMLGN